MDGLPANSRHHKALPSQEELRKLFSYENETGRLVWKSRLPAKPSRTDKIRETRFTGQEAGHLMKQGYLAVRLDGVLFLVHRIIWKLVTGEDPRFVDHVDLVKSNNKWGNLRECSKTENQGNRTKTPKNVSGYKNITRCCRRWVITITKHGVTHRDSCFTLAGAVAIQRLRSAQLYGKFARSV